MTAVILLTAGIITFVAVLHTVRVIIRESGGALERDVQIVASLFSLCGIILLTALILFFVWNVRIAAKFEICRMGAELDREKSPIRPKVIFCPACLTSFERDERYRGTDDTGQKIRGR